MISGSQGQGLSYVITYEGIENVVSSLDYSNPNTLKHKYIQAVLSRYAPDIDVLLVEKPDPDRLIRDIWNLPDDPEQIRSKRKNLSSIRSTVNSDLKALFQKGLNPEGITVGPDHLFVMSDEAKNERLSAFAQSIKSGAHIDLMQVADVLKLIGDFIEKNSDELRTPRSSELLENIQNVLKMLGSETGESAAPGSGSGPFSEESEGPGQENPDMAGQMTEDLDDLEKIDLDEIEEVDEDQVDIVDEDEIEEVDEDQVDIIDEDEIEEVDEDQVDIVDEDEIEEIDEDQLDVVDEDEIEEVDEDQVDIVDEDEIEKVDEDQVDIVDEDEIEEVDEDQVDIVDEDEIEEVDEDQVDIVDEDEIEEVDEDQVDIVDEDEIEELDEDQVDIVDEDEIEEVDEDQVDIVDEDEIEEVDEDQVDIIDEDDLEEIDENKIDIIDEEDLEEIDENEVDIIDEEELQPYPPQEFQKESGGIGIPDDSDQPPIGPDEEKRRLSEQFTKELTAMDRYYNSYLHIPKGRYTIGSPAPQKHEATEHEVILDDFYIGKFPVTNALFEVFVARTGYRTTAEKKGHGTVYTGRFRKATDRKTGQIRSVWNATFSYQIVKGACWYHPDGPSSTIAHRLNHPVVQVSLEDAFAFASWVGKTLPSEAQWEASGRTDKGFIYPWGNAWMDQACNMEKSAISETTPVDRYLDFVNEYKIADLLGNVLEWTSDMIPSPYSPQSAQHYAIAKGGSWISSQPVSLWSRFIFKEDYTANILGFRCVAR